LVLLKWIFKLYKIKLIWKMQSKKGDLGLLFIYIFYLYLSIFLMEEKRRKQLKYVEIIENFNFFFHPYAGCS